MSDLDFNKVIKEEIDGLIQKLDAVNSPVELEESIKKRIQILMKTAQFGGFSREYENISKYIEWVLQVPWDKYSPDQLDLISVRKTMDSHNYGLDKVKERIQEYIASMQLKFQKGGQQQIVSAPVMCFVGLQGIGKTSLAKGIGDALGREVIRISMGGLGSTFELRGKPKTEVDAEPGQIIKALIKAQSMNPLIILDEIDKVSGNEEKRKDFMAILLEILDPEQNYSFRDHYLDYPVDLSKVFFICTANNLGTVSAALLDRLEIIRFYSYSDEEKIVIGKRYVLPEIMAEVGLEEGQLEFADDAWEKIVRPLGYDAGIRQLKRNLYSICRKAAKIIVLGQATKVLINENNAKSFIDESFAII